VNCTFYANASLNADPVCGGGAVYVYNAGAVVGVTNCIFWQNSSASGASSASILLAAGTLNLGYCDIDTSGVSGGTLNYGAGILNADPLFASTNMPYDMHVKSYYGRWSPAAPGGWAKDAETSPCIDAGDPASSYALESEPNGKRVNLGAYGNTPQASRSKSIRGTVISVW
jgi:hypothetical protein